MGIKKELEKLGIVLKRDETSSKNSYNLYMAEDAEEKLIPYHERLIIERLNTPFTLYQTDSGQHIFKLHLFKLIDNKIIIDIEKLSIQTEYSNLEYMEILIFLSVTEKLLDYNFPLSFGNNLFRNYVLNSYCMSENLIEENLNNIIKYQSNDLFNDNDNATLEYYIDMRVSIIRSKVVRRCYNLDYCTNNRFISNPVYRYFSDINNEKINLYRPDLNLFYVPFTNVNFGNSNISGLLLDYIILNNDQKFEAKDKIDKYFDELVDDFKKRLESDPSKLFENLSTRSRGPYYNIAFSLTYEANFIKTKLNFSPSNQHPLNKKRNKKGVYGIDYFDSKMRESLFKVITILIKHFETLNQNSFLEKMEKTLATNEIQNYIGYNVYPELYFNNPQFKDSLKRVKQYEALSILDTI